MKISLTSSGCTPGATTRGIPGEVCAKAGRDIIPPKTNARRQLWLFCRPVCISLPMDSPIRKLSCAGERPDFRLRLRIGQIAQLGFHAARNGGGFASALEAGEVRPVFPGERAAQPLAR